MGLEFQEEQNLTPIKTNQPRVGLAEKLVTLGIAPNVTIANLLLLCVTFVVLIVGYLVVSSMHHQTLQLPPAPPGTHPEVDNVR